MVIAIASGKGGTGKTTIAVNLANSLKQPVRLLDCDVEEPNAHLFLKGNLTSARHVNIPVPSVSVELCRGCGECSTFCKYNAIVTINSKVMVFPDLCHGCGGCMLVCPENAITESPRKIGIVESFFIDDQTSLVHGRLVVGVPVAPPVIKAVKENISPEIVTIIDSPPGTSCPVVTSLKNADFVVLVTEPTPFGLNDLCLALDMVKEMGLPHGVVINRSDIGDTKVQMLCTERNIPVLLEIPEDRSIALAYSNGKLLSEELPEYSSLFLYLFEKIHLQLHRKSNSTGAH